MNLNKSSKKICIVRLSAIGDITLCLPIVRAIRNSIPDSQITWITTPESYSLLEGVNDVEFILLDKKRGLSEYLELKKKLKNRSFDYLLALQASWRANFIYPLVKAPVKIGFDKNRSKDFQFMFINQRINFTPNQHLLDSFLSFLLPLGINDPEVSWNLPIDEERRWAYTIKKSIKEKILLINPVASKLERTWRIDNYISTIKEAKERWNIHVILTGGKNSREIEVGATIKSEFSSGITNLIGRTSIKQYAALIECVDAVLSPDTAAVHLATALNKPTIGLYAVAPPEITGPYRSNRFVINKFPEAARTFLGKNPEALKWGTRVHSQKAMDLISVRDVIGKLEEVYG